MQILCQLSLVLLLDVNYRRRSIMEAFIAFCFKIKKVHFKEVSTEFTVVVNDRIQWEYARPPFTAILLYLFVFFIFYLLYFSIKNFLHLQQEIEWITLLKNSCLNQQRRGRKLKHWKKFTSNSMSHHHIQRDNQKKSICSQFRWHQIRVKRFWKESCRWNSSF